MSNLKLRVPVPFPALVYGEGGIAVTKENGQWRVAPDFSMLASIPSVTDPANKQLWIYDPISGVYNVLNLNVLSKALNSFPAAADLDMAGYSILNIKDAEFNGSSSGSTVVQAEAAASGTLTLPAATDTLVARDTADTLTNKTIDTANNTLKIAGNDVDAVTGTGTTVALADSPVLTGATVAADPSVGLGVASKQYVDNVAAGLDIKPSVQAATTGNITLSGEQTIDTIALTAGERALVKDQTAPEENGIYVVASGAWSRAADMNDWAEVLGALVLVEQGAVNADSGWIASGAQGGVIGTDAITWSQFFGTGLFQPSSAFLTSIAALGTAADKMIVTTAPGTAAEYPMTAAGRAMAGAADAAAQTALLSPFAGSAKGLIPTVSAQKGAFLRDDGAFASVPDELSYAVMQMQVAKNAGAALVWGNRFADSFDALTYVDTAGATNLDTATAGVLKPSTSVVTLIPTMTGATTGGVSMSASEAQTSYDAWKAADGTQPNAAQSDWASVNPPSVGAPKLLHVDLGTAAIVSSYELGASGWSSNSSQNNMLKDWTLEGSNNGSTWTTIDTRTGAPAWSSAENRTYTIASPGAYRHYRLSVTATQNGQLILLGKIQLTRKPTNNLTVASNALSAASAPASAKLVAQYKPVDSVTLGTDLMFDVSRDGGTTWSAVTMADRFTSPSPVADIHVLEGDVNVSGQPSGTSMKWRARTDNRKDLELHAVALSW